jgi:hypothetical protein
MIGLADVDINECDQIRNALAYGDKKLGEIRNRMKELKDMEQDMIRVRHRLTNRLAELEKEKNDV